MICFYFNFRYFSICQFRDIKPLNPPSPPLAPSLKKPCLNSVVSALCTEKLFLKKILWWFLCHTEEIQNWVCQVFLKLLNKLFSPHQRQMLCQMWRRTNFVIPSGKLRGKTPWGNVIHKQGYQISIKWSSQSWR